MRPPAAADSAANRWADGTTAQAGQAEGVVSSRGSAAGLYLQHPFAGVQGQRGAEGSVILDKHRIAVFAGLGRPADQHRKVTHRGGRTPGIREHQLQNLAPAVIVRRQRPSQGQLRRAVRIESLAGHVGIRNFQTRKG